jgi:hypothetical protein
MPQEQTSSEDTSRRAPFGVKPDLLSAGEWRPIRTFHFDSGGTTVNKRFEQRFGRRVAAVVRRFKDAAPLQTERINEAEFRRQNVRRKEALSGAKM